VTKNTLPTYAIVELLIRLSHINPLIGDYKGHIVYDDGVIVKTTGGTITFPKKLVVLQFESPETIAENTLHLAANGFTSNKKTR
jgi:hypothetical protein